MVSSQVQLKYQAVDVAGMGFRTARKYLRHNLTAVVNPVGNPEVYTQSYQALAGHYGLESLKTQPGHPNENGDVEQRNHL